jgi:hypothetical protein
MLYFKSVSSSTLNNDLISIASSSSATHDSANAIASSSSATHDSANAIVSLCNNRIFYDQQNEDSSNLACASLYNSSSIVNLTVPNVEPNTKRTKYHRVAKFSANEKIKNQINELPLVVTEQTFYEVDYVRSHFFNDNILYFNIKWKNSDEYLFIIH